MIDLIRYDAGYKVLNKVRSSPSYWEDKKRNLLAMIRQLGTPTFFLTLSAAENHWPELLQALSKLINNKRVSLADALKMSDAEKAKLIKSDPVTCARYYDHKVRNFMKYLRNAGGPFHKYTVIDSYIRVEFQARGSPHVHTLLWCNDAPESIEDDDEQVLNFIDRFITCKYDGDNEKNVYVKYQIHKHKSTCYKGQKNKFNCRFDIPYPVMSKTMILSPLEEDQKEEWMVDAFKRIQIFMNDLFKKPRDILFSEILESLNLNEEQYILAIRSSLSRKKVFLRRRSQEVGINAYNSDVINMFESNMDIQYITDPYACASYILNYISKVDAGLTKFLKQAANDISDGNFSIKNRLRNVANVFLNSNIMSAQEAAYHVLSLPLSISSRATIYINTVPISERVRMLKPDSQIRLLDETSCDIYLSNAQEKYAIRPEKYEYICMADYFAVYKQSGKKINNAFEETNEDEENLDNDENEIENDKRQKTLILRYRRYKLDTDPDNYFREKLLLFIPWRNEFDEIENINYKEKYDENLLLIEENQAKYSIISDILIDEALKKVCERMQTVNENEINDFEKNELNDEYRVDILEQAGMEKPKNMNKKIKFTLPTILSREIFEEQMQKLNEKQRMIVMHILYLIKTNTTPFHIFLGGSAGVGKSTVINAIFQSINIYYNSLPGELIDIIHVLLCAPSGKASYNIGGQTLHAAFSLPVNQFGGRMPSLSNDTANPIREKLSYTKLLIIDEVSMVGARALSQVDTRLQQIKGINEPFGGISVLIVGDLKQLPPVMDRFVFMNPTTTCLNYFVESPLWSLFHYFPLTEIMRQKNETAFINALNNLAIGQMTDDDIKLIKSRVVKKSEVPYSAIRLFVTNKLVDEYNRNKINSHPGTEYISKAHDVIKDKMDSERKKKFLNSLQKMAPIQTGGLRYSISLKIDIKYMLISNLDVEDGLVNGACGILRKISFNESEQPLILWIDFGIERVGHKLKLKYKEYAKEYNIPFNWVPILHCVVPINIKANISVTRKQFPLVPAEAITIHKSQGQTYTEICLDLQRNQRITRCLLYVALSRVTKLHGLFIIGNFKAPKPPQDSDPVLMEINRLEQSKLLTITAYNEHESYNFKAVFHNVRSLKKNIKNIISDKWYLTSTVLIFAETGTIMSDEIKIPGYDLYYRSDRNFSQRKASRGVMIFVEKNVQEKCILESEYNNGT